MYIFIRNSGAKFSPGYILIHENLNTFITVNIKTSLDLTEDF